MTGEAPARPRVLAYTDADDVGGAETSLATLMGALGPQADVVIAVTDRRVGSFLQERCPAAEVRVLPRVASKTDVRAILRHVRLLRELRPDILHANLPHPWTGQYGIMATAFARGTRVVAVEHSPRPTASRAQRLLRRLVRRRIDVQVTVGSQSARDLERLLGCPEGSVRVIPNGVPDRAPAAAPADAPAPRTTPRPTIGFVGRLAHEKGPDVLVRALAELPGVHALLVGGGALHDELLALAAELGVADRLTLAGWHDDPRALLHELDLLVMPSRIESFGIVAVEAMLAELPVVATGVGSVPEVVEDGVTGLLTEPEDPAALAAAIRAVLDDPGRAAEMGRRGRERALGRFSQQHMVEQFLALYRELGARRGGRRRSLVRFTTLERVRWKLWLCYLQARGVPKTVVFNLRYLPLRQALRFPVAVSHRTVFRRLGGRVVIEGPVRRGMVRLGYGGIDFFDRRRSWAVWHVVDGGEVIFRGQALIGHGSSVEAKGTLVLGDRVQVMAESRLMCHDRIEIGDGTLISWEVMVMDTDHHAMLDERGARRPVTAPIAIGPESWIGTRVTVLKGVTLGAGTVVAAGTTVHRSFPEGATVVAGTGARAVRHGVRWEP